MCFGRLLIPNWMKEGRLLGSDLLRTTQPVRGKGGSPCLVYPSLVGCNIANASWYLDTPACKFQEGICPRGPRHRLLPQGWSCLVSPSAFPNQRNLEQRGMSSSEVSLNWTHIAHSRRSAKSCSISERRNSFKCSGCVEYQWKPSGLPTFKLLPDMGAVSCIFLFLGRGDFWT